MFHFNRRSSDASYVGGREWSIKPFNDEIDSQALKQEWEEWLESFEFEAETKGDFSQKELFNLLMTKGGRSLQRIFKNQKPVAEEVLEVKVPLLEIPLYDNAVARLNNFFLGKTNVRMEKEIFRAIRQDKNESFNKFLLKLRSQARRCQFGTQEEEEILHQVITGAWSEKVRDKGVDTAITLDSLMQYAINREILDKQKQKDHDREDGQQLAAIQQAVDKKPTTIKKCGRCGTSNHIASECRAKQMRCYKCNMMGHLARACRARIELLKPTTDRPKYKEGNKRWNEKTGNMKSEIRSVEPNSEWFVDIPKKPGTSNEQVNQND